MSNDHVIPINVDSELDQVVPSTTSSPPSPSMTTKAKGWFAFCRRHLPALISAFSVLLNALVLGFMIPQLKADITYMQGQTASIQSQVQGNQQSLIDMSGKISGANAEITQFYTHVSQMSQSLNTTQTEIGHFRASTQTILDNSRQEINLLEQRVEQAKITINNTLSQVTVGTTSSLKLLQDTNTSAMSHLIQVRDELQLQIIPRFLKSMAQLNQTDLTLKLQEASSNLTRMSQSVANWGRSENFTPVVSGTGSGTAGINYATNPSCYHGLCQSGQVVRLGQVMIYSWSIIGTIQGTPSGFLQISMPPGCQAVNSWSKGFTAWGNAVTNNLLFYTSGSFINLMDMTTAQQVAMTSGVFNLQGTLICTL